VKYLLQHSADKSAMAQSLKVLNCKLRNYMLIMFYSMF